jgi:hypothetical protein
MLSALVIILFDVKVIVDPIKGVINKLRKFIDTRKVLIKASLLVLIVAAVPFMYKHMTLERFETGVTSDPAQTEEEAKKVEDGEVNDVSVNARLEFIMDSKDILLGNPVYLIIGAGYGMEIAGRVNGIEMTFLDVLVEQGLIGLFIWIFLCLIVYYNYHVAYRKGSTISGMDISLLAAFMGVLMLTNINPFLNNPIGITFFLIMLIFSQYKKESISIPSTK